MASEKIQLLIGAENRTQAAFDQVNKNVTKLEKNVQNLKRLGNVFVSLFAVNQVAGYAKELGVIADEWKNIEGRLKLVTDSSEELKQVQDDLFNVSQKTSSSYKATADLYAQVARNSDALGLSNKDLINLTEVINQSIQVSGASATASEAAITQLNQALGSGVLRGDEFNSIMEQAPRLSQALADGLGVPIGALRQMAQEGELTAERVTKALLDQRDVIEREYGALPETIGRNTTRLENEFWRLVSELDSATGASDKAATSLGKFANILGYTSDQISKYSNGISTAFDYTFEFSDQLQKIVNPTRALADMLLDTVNAEAEAAQAIKDTKEKTEELTSATDDLIESEYALQVAQEKEQEILDTKQQKIDDVLASLQEESELLKMTAKEQFVYSQVKKAGEDITDDQIDSIREAAEALFDEKEQLKENRKEREKLTRSTKEYKEVEESASRTGSSSSLFGKAKEEVEELTEETEKATKAKREWLTASSQDGKDTSDAFDPVNLTPEQAKQKAKEIKDAMQQEFDNNPVQVKVKVPTFKEATETVTTSSSYYDTSTGLSALSIATEALKTGSK